MIRALRARVAALFRPHKSPMHIAAVQYLAPGVTVYAVDIDGRRIVMGATPHALCVLDNYPLASAARSGAEGAAPGGA
jgi:hypothetical protein